MAVEELRATIQSLRVYGDPRWQPLVERVFFMYDSSDRRDVRLTTAACVCLWDRMYVDGVSGGVEEEDAEEVVVAVVWSSSVMRGELS